MRVVIADTSPLNYLILIGEIEILRRLYGNVLLPPEVLAELTETSAPRAVLDWIQSRPEWLDVRPVRRHGDERELQHLGPGERAAILLALEEPEVLLLVDDAAARAEADRRRIPSTGTLGILRTAAVLGLLDLPTALSRLAVTNFRVSRSLIDELLSEDSARRGQSS
jgi:predicted nucleic acid-binding protein